MKIIYRHTRGVRTDPVACLPPLSQHRHPTPWNFPPPGCCGGGDATALLLIPSRFRAQLLSLPGQPPPVTYPIALSFSDHTQPRPPYVPPTHPGDKQAGTATFRSTVPLSVIPVFCVLFARNDRGQTPAVTMNRRRWPGRPPFNRVLAALAVIAAARIVPQSPAAHAADDSLRSALEAISDKIGETQPPPRLVYLNPGKTDGARETRTVRVPEAPTSAGHDKPRRAQEYKNSAPGIRRGGKRQNYRDDCPRKL